MGKRVISEDRDAVGRLIRGAVINNAEIYLRRRSCPVDLTVLAELYVARPIDVTVPLDRGKVEEAAAEYIAELAAQGWELAMRYIQYRERSTG